MGTHVQNKVMGNAFNRVTVTKSGGIGHLAALLCQVSVFHVLLFSCKSPGQDGIYLYS